MAKTLSYPEKGWHPYSKMCELCELCELFVKKIPPLSRWDFLISAQQNLFVGRGGVRSLFRRLAFSIAKVVAKKAAGWWIWRYKLNFCSDFCTARPKFAPKFAPELQAFAPTFAALFDKHIAGTYKKISYRLINPTAFAMGFSYFYSAEFIRHFRNLQKMAP